MTSIHEEVALDRGIVGNFHNRRRTEHEAELSNQTFVGRTTPRKLENPDYEIETVGKMLDEKG